MTQKNRTQCKENAAWYAQQLSEWKADFLDRLAREGPRPSRKSATEFQTIKRAARYYFETLVQYSLVREG